MPKRQTSIHLLLILQHLVNFPLSSLLCPPQALLQLGLLLLLSFLYLLLEAGDHLRRPKHREHCRVATRNSLPRDLVSLPKSCRREEPPSLWQRWVRVLGISHEGVMMLTLRDQHAQGSALQARLAASHLPVLGLQRGRELLQLSSVLTLQCCHCLGNNEGPVKDAGREDWPGTDSGGRKSQESIPNTPRAKGLRGTTSTSLFLQCNSGPKVCN